MLLSVWVRVAVLTKPWLEIFTRFHADFNKKPHYFATHSVRKPAMGCPDLTLVRHVERVEEQGIPGIPFIPGILGEAGQEISVFLT